MGVNGNVESKNILYKSLVQCPQSSIHILLLLILILINSLSIQAHITKDIPQKVAIVTHQVEQNHIP